MTPKEKAEELVDKFYNIDLDSNMFDDFNMNIFYAQRCALICINEMIRICYDHTMASYYGEVKQEIEKL